MGPCADSDRITFDKVTVVSFHAELRAAAADTGTAPQEPSLADRDAWSAPTLRSYADLARIPVRVSREGMLLKRVAGYWVKWAEEPVPGEIVKHSEWYGDQEYLQPGRGSVDGSVTATVVAHWIFDRGNPADSMTTSHRVAFGPGETVREIVLDRPAPERPAALCLFLGEAELVGGGPQEIMFGAAEPAEADGGGEGDLVLRAAEYTTGFLPPVVS